MGLFSQLRAGNGKPALNSKDAKVKAVIAVPVLTAAADGNIDELEMRQLVNTAAFNPSVLEIGGERLMEMIREIAGDIHKRGFDAVIDETAAALDGDAALTAMSFAMRVALADGVLEEGEKAMLAAVASKLGIADSDFAAIFRVMVLMQKRFA